MSNQEELSLVWRQLTNTYQQMNGCSSRAEAKRLLAMAEILRVEYRHLTSTYK